MRRPLAGLMTTTIGTLTAIVGAINVAHASPADLEPDPRIELLVAEIEAGIEQRGLTDEFQRYLAWTADRLDRSAGDRTWDDKTGNCRLDWVDRLLRDPLWSLDEGERFTRYLHEAAKDERRALPRILATAARKLDVPGRDGESKVIALPEPESVDDALAIVRDALVAASAAFDEAVAPLSDAELEFLEANVYEQSTGEGARGHRFADTELGREVCDLIEKLDRRALHRAAEAVAPLADPLLLTTLADYEADDDGEAVPVEGVEGRIYQRIATPVGDILIGSRDDNTYDLERLHDVAAVIDLGGDNTYLEGTVGPHRRVLALIDLDGEDTYRGELPGIQGGAVMGVSLLVNRGGDSIYEARNVAQGSCLVGAGILVDYGGDNRYLGRRRVQGTAIGGVGLLIDRAGDDAYRGALLAQGVGGPLGFGMLVDLAGDDAFFAGGLYDNVYGDSAGYDGFSQGVGIGPRGVANGGIGVLLAGGGDNVYECDYFSHGGGYWFAAGFARDFAGNDQRLGATRTMHDGSEREQRRFLRWGVGWQAHYGVGIVIDDEGDDFYRADHAGPAFSWDIGTAAVIDFAGDDRFENAQGQGAEAGLGILFSAAGNNVYHGGAQGLAREEVTYHPMPDAGGNFSFLIDYGERSEFDHADEHGEHRRGGPGGFLIWRPEMPTVDEIR